MVGLRGLGWASVGIAAAAVLLQALWRPQSVPAPAPQVAATAVATPHPLDPTPAAQRHRLRGPEAFGQWIEAESSLRGTELDGSWDVDTRGEFKPTLALRRRFDHLLTLIGEARVEELTAFIGHEVQAWGGPAARTQVLQAWERYLALQRHPFRMPVQLNDRNALLAALGERQQVRRQLLGPVLAEAFFAAEEAELQALLQHGVRSEAQAASPIDPARLDAQARQRLQQEEAAWADWERRLAQARQDVQALQAEHQLSDPQRQAAIDQLLAQRFAPGEAVRVRALLQL